MCLFRSLVATILFSAFLPGSRRVMAQQIPVPPASPAKGLIRMSKEERDARARSDHRIVLNVVVDDASGHPVAGLREDDFTLFDHEQRRLITSFQVVSGRSASGLAHIDLVIDSLNNSFQDVARQRHAVESYLQSSGDELPYPVSLLLLSDTGVRTIDPSKDRKFLIRELRERFPRPGRFSFNGGPSGGNQRFLTSIHALRTIIAEERDMPGRAILIWLGHGWPSLLDPGYAAATSDDKRSYFDTLVEISTLAREAQVTIDNIVSPEPNNSAEGNEQVDRGLMHGARNFQEIEARNLALPLIAYQSGGRLLDGSKDMTEQIVRCVSDAEVYYRLSFDPQAAAAPNELRSLEVRVSEPEFTPRTNLIYYAQP